MSFARSNITRISIPAIRLGTLVYAICGATLYCSLMPLWEGFDEIYHYAYVQHLAITGTFPVIGVTRLSREVERSLDDLPVSHYIQPHLYLRSINFLEYFNLSADRRDEMRRAVDSLDRNLRREPSTRQTYEAMQAPLTYLLLAPVDAALANVALTTRVLVLRLLLSFLGFALLWIGTRRLAALLGLNQIMEAACLFCLFSCQMIYAETCRVGNDALLPGWLLLLLVSVIHWFQTPSVAGALRTSSLMACGWMIKSSALAFLPLILAAPLGLILRDRRWKQAALQLAISCGVFAVVAGPWYARNLRLYHNLTATVESTSGIGTKVLLRAARELPWGESLAQTARYVLWTGNNSFITFSQTTLDVILGLVGLAIVIYFFHRRGEPAEWITLVSIALYGCLILAITLAFFASSRGAVISAMPWYLQVPLAPVLVLAFLGLSRLPRWGSWLASVTVVLWGYVAAATWIVKLIPLYGGMTSSHVSKGKLASWYLRESAARNSILSTLCPAPPAMLYILLTIVLLTLLAISFSLIYALWPGRAS